jgi:polysaccharide pyruvyl transferase WcaK-like protein
MSQSNVADRVNIGLLEHFGTGNLGDDATVAAALQHIRSRWPHAVIVGLSLFPFDSESRHNIPCYPIRRGLFSSNFSPKPHRLSTNFVLTFKNMLKACLARYQLLILLRFISAPISVMRELLFLAKSYRVAKSLDILVVCGGGQLLDSWGGPWAFPYTIFKWVMLAKLARAKCYFLNVGAGPIDHSLSKWFVRRSLFFADYVSLRDHKSKALIREIGFRGKLQVVADNVYGLQLPDAKNSISRIRERSELIVGISPMAYCDPRRYWNRDRATYETFIQKLAGFSAGLIQKHHKLSFFSSDIWFDSEAIVDLDAALKSELAGDTSRWVTCPPVKDIDDLLSQLSRVDCIITCKFHGVVFGHLLNIPVLAIAHHPKVATLMDDFGLSEYCVDIRKFDADLLTTKFEQLMADATRLKSQMATRVALCRKQLAFQFDSLFPLGFSAITGSAK